MESATWVDVVSRKPPQGKGQGARPKDQGKGLSPEAQQGSLLGGMPKSRGQGGRSGASAPNNSGTRQLDTPPPCDFADRLTRLQGPQGLQGPSRS